MSFSQLRFKQHFALFCNVIKLNCLYLWRIPLFQKNKVFSLRQVYASTSLKREPILGVNIMSRTLTA